MCAHARVHVCAHVCMCVHVCACVCKHVCLVCTCVRVPSEGSALCFDTRGLSEMASPTASPAQTLVPRPPGGQGQRREARGSRELFHAGLHFQVYYQC